jgi:hypothetical protein
MSMILPEPICQKIAHPSAINQAADHLINGILCTLTTAADRWDVQEPANNLPQDFPGTSF